MNAIFQGNIAKTFQLVFLLIHRELNFINFFSISYIAKRNTVPNWFFYAFCLFLHLIEQWHKRDHQGGQFWIIYSWLLVSVSWVHGITAWLLACPTYARIKAIRHIVKNKKLSNSSFLPLTQQLEPNRCSSLLRTILLL